LEHFHEQVGAFERTMVDVYERWLDFERAFAKDHDSATVVGTVFVVIARAVISMRLLTLGHITLSGAAQRQSCEALASAFLFAEREWPYRRDSWEGRFSVNKAVDVLIRRSGELNLNPAALQTLRQARHCSSKLDSVSLWPGDRLPQVHRTVQPSCRSASSAWKHSTIWFQLANVALTKYVLPTFGRSARSWSPDGCVPHRFIGQVRR
jgi:hypothetical protein